MSREIAVSFPLPTLNRDIDLTLFHLQISQVTLICMQEMAKQTNKISPLSMVLTKDCCFTTQLQDTDGNGRSDWSWGCSTILSRASNLNEVLTDAQDYAFANKGIALPGVINVFVFDRMRWRELNPTPSKSQPEFHLADGKTVKGNVFFVG